MCKTVQATVIAVALFVLAACQTASGPAFQPLSPSAGGGVVYIYTTNSSASQWGSASIKIDGRKIGKLAGRGYLAEKVTPGRHTVAMGGLIVDPKVEVNVPHGGAAYVRLDIVYDGLSYGPSGPIPIYVTKMRKVPTEVGRTEIAATRRSS